MKQICFLLIPMVVFISSLNAQASFNDLNVCGKSRLAMNRIVGGSTARQGEFPWQVALMRRGRTLPICGGTLISDKWIITAAHCLRDLSTLEGVVLGAHAFGFNVNEATREERNIVFNDIKVHPDYNPATFHNDIALIPMNRPVQYTSNIRPACLVDVAPPAGSEVVISGWGTISAGGPQSAILKDTKVNIVSRERCQASFEDAIITQNMMCAAASGTDACQGDSGGPMVLNQRDANGIDQFYLAGIISWGRGCARPDFPGVYTNVANLRGWIDEIVSADQEVIIETPEVTEPSETIDTAEATIFDA
ncbi:trypsin delta-like [Clytia hemisphaerica]